MVFICPIFYIFYILHPDSIQSVLSNVVVLLLAHVMFDAKILNNIIMQIADGKISAWSKHHVF